MLPNPFLPPVPDTRTRKGFLVALALFGLDRGEHGAEPFVGLDVALGDSALFIEDGEGA
jgi:hypothetical protein